MRSRSAGFAVVTRRTKPQRLKAFLWRGCGAPHFTRGLLDKTASLLQILFAVSIPQEPVGAVPNEALRKHVLQKAVQELLRLQAEKLLLIAMPPSERDSIIFVGLDPVVGDRHAVGVPRQVPEQLLGPPKGGFA